MDALQLMEAASSTPMPMDDDFLRTCKSTSDTQLSSAASSSPPAKQKTTTTTETSIFIKEEEQREEEKENVESDNEDGKRKWRRMVQQSEEPRRQQLVTATDENCCKQSADIDRKYLAELEQELSALDSLCAASLLSSLEGGYGGSSTTNNALRPLMRRQPQELRRHNDDGDTVVTTMDFKFKHSRELLVSEVTKLRFRLSVEWVADAQPKQQQQPLVAAVATTTPTNTATTPLAAATTKLSALSWSQMVVKSTPRADGASGGMKSGKRPHRPDTTADDQQQHHHQQFGRMSITDQGLVQMSVKVPFPESAMGNDGRCQNLIGRILGPRGISVRQLEMQYGCKILIRGKGSIKDIAKEKRLRGKPEGRHLDEKLHVLVEAQELSREQCVRKLIAARRCIEKLMVPVFDEYKRQQLIQLAIINGTYRSRSRKDGNAGSRTSALAV